MDFSTSHRPTPSTLNRFCVAMNHSWRHQWFHLFGDCSPQDVAAGVLAVKVANNTLRMTFPSALTHMHTGS